MTTKIKQEEENKKTITLQLPKLLGIRPEDILEFKHFAHLIEFEDANDDHFNRAPYTAIKIEITVTEEAYARWQEACDGITK